MLKVFLTIAIAPILIAGVSLAVLSHEVKQSGPRAAASCESPRLIMPASDKEVSSDSLSQKPSDREARFQAFRSARSATPSDLAIASVPVNPLRNVSASTSAVVAPGTSSYSPIENPGHFTETTFPVTFGSGGTVGTPGSKKELGTSQPAVQLPAALVADSPDIPITTDQQVVEWEKIQDDFIAKTGGTYPANEPSRVLWRDARREADALFRAKFGVQAFLVQQIEGFRESGTYQ